MNNQERKRLLKAGKPVIQLHFLGAAGHVTGSMNLIEYWQGEKVTRFLLDAGLNMENRRLDFGNRFPRGIAAKDIDFIVLSHAHIDHSGYLPKLVNDGFRGRVYCTAASADLTKILLPDSGYLQEEAVKRANRLEARRQAQAAASKAPAKKGHSKQEAGSEEVVSRQPLYTEKQAQNSLKYLSPLSYFETHELAPGVKVRFTEAGHILGSAVTTLEIGTGSHKKTLCFTGNIGRRDAPLLRKLEAVHGADYLITEATYGNKLHHKRDRLEELARIVNEGYERARQAERGKGKGVILIPAFAVGRAQAVLNDLRILIETGRIPNMKVFLDGRMSIAATQVHRQYEEDLDAATRAVFDEGKDPFRTPRFEQCKVWQESEALMTPQSEPIIIVGSSGMANGGRIVGHLQHRLTGRNNTVAFIGYQGTGTLGHSLVRFADNPPASIQKCEAPCPKTVRVQGKQLTVRAKVEFMSDYSAHADYSDILWWLKQMKRRPVKTFIVHGDEDALAGLQERIRSTLNWTVEVPKPRESVYLT
ncbi:MBL fold metallo-hydrolase [bacterium]|nr:MBL fold metallo-hydrolase [bacterium]